MSRFRQPAAYTVFACVFAALVFSMAVASTVDPADDNVSSRLHG